jgi:hypothetical protein
MQIEGRLEGLLKQQELHTLMSLQTVSLLTSLIMCFILVRHVTMSSFMAVVKLRVRTMFVYIPNPMSDLIY